MEIFQHILVTAIAAGAAGIVVWRIATAGRSESEAPSCDSCPTARTMPPRKEG